jgi:hypothetical protein
MVKVFNEDGVHIFNEPPYTWEEKQEFYRRIGGGPKVVLHAPRPVPNEVKSTSPKLPRPPAK